MSFHLDPGSEDFIKNIVPNFNGTYTIYYKDGQTFTVVTPIYKARNLQEHNDNIDFMVKAIKKDSRYTVKLNKLRDN